MKSVTGESYIETARKLILKEFSFLELLGYKNSFEILDSEVFVEYMQIAYYNEEKRERLV